MSNCIPHVYVDVITYPCHRSNVGLAGQAEPAKKQTVDNVI